MNKLLFYKILSAILLVLNIGLIVFTLMKKPPPKKGPKHSPKEEIIDRLQFDSQQAEEYKRLLQGHKSLINKQDQHIRKLKKELYHSLSSEGQDLNEDSLLLKLNEHRANIELIHLNHLKDIKGLCTEKQLPAFDKLSKELGRIFSPKKEPRPPKHKKR